MSSLHYSYIQCSTDIPPMEYLYSYHGKQQRHQDKGIQFSSVFFLWIQIRGFAASPLGLACISWSVLTDSHIKGQRPSPPRFRQCNGNSTPILDCHPQSNRALHLEVETMAKQLSGTYISREHVFQWWKYYISNQFFSFATQHLQKNQTAAEQHQCSSKRALHLEVPVLHTS